jgi:hypothetical protein
VRAPSISQRILLLLAALAASGVSGGGELRLLRMDGVAGAPAETVVELDPIHLHDLVPTPGPGMPEARREVAATRSGLIAAGPLSALPPVSPLIERRLPLRWQVRLPPGRGLHDLRLSAELESAHGEPGALALDTAQAVPARLRVEGPWLVAVDERGQVAEGGLVLEIPSERLGPRPGTLEARLVLRAELD